jgi:cysteine synthase B
MHKIQDLIGNTPLVELKNPWRNAVKIFGKMEGNNPGGSVKDRAAYAMIKDALDSGKLNHGVTLIEATSGNTGIALAMIAAMLKVPIELVMPENATRERVQTMRAFGARVILTPSQGGMESAIDLVATKAHDPQYFTLNQFANPNNPLAHYRTTGPEIYRDTLGCVTHFVSSMGTTGTIMGTGKYLKEQDPSIQIVGVQPKEGSRIPGIRKWPENYLPKIYDPTFVDTLVEVSENEARESARRLAKEEAIFSGMSSGGAVLASLKIAETLDKGIIVCILCDRGDRYLSDGLFE